jgi:hypothetical protein
VARSRRRYVNFIEKSPVNWYTSAILIFSYDFSLVVGLNVDYLLHCVDY